MILPRVPLKSSHPRGGILRIIYELLRESLLRNSLGLLDKLLTEEYSGPTYVLTRQRSTSRSRLPFKHTFPDMGRCPSGISFVAEVASWGGTAHAACLIRDEREAPAFWSTILMASLAEVVSLSWTGVRDNVHPNAKHTTGGKRSRASRLLSAGSDHTTPDDSHKTQPKPIASRKLFFDRLHRNTSIAALTTVWRVETLLLPGRRLSSCQPPSPEVQSGCASYRGEFSVLISALFHCHFFIGPLSCVLVLPSPHRKYSIYRRLSITYYYSRGRTAVRVRLSFRTPPLIKLLRRGHQFLLHHRRHYYIRNSELESSLLRPSWPCMSVAAR